jgi:succinyl-diaminopimelate desuccinylase
VESLLSKRAVVKRIKNKNTEILIAGNSSTLSPDIGYMVHMDVVSGKPEQFRINIEGDKMIGRGTSDMKFSIPIGVSILNNLIAEKSELTFSLVITTDEEIGGFDGGAHLAEELKFRPKCLIVPDGGDNLTFVNKAKGVCQLIITSKGSPAHASRPWMGKNALEPLVKLGNELIKFYGKNSLKENWNTTMNMGQIQGGISINQVCPEAVMKLDFRYPETDSIENITATVTKLSKNISPNLTISTASTGMPTFTDKGLSVVKDFLSAMEKSYGKQIVVTQTYGASDARHFAKYNIPVLMMKPLGGVIHSENEWVSINSSLKFYEGLKLFLDGMEGNN